MALRLSLKSLKKIQPGKILKKVAQFIPGGKEATDLVEGAIDAVKRRTTSVASGEASVTTVDTGNIPAQIPKNAIYLIGAAVVILLIFLMVRKR